MEGKIEVEVKQEVDGEVDNWVNTSLNAAEGANTPGVKIVNSVPGPIKIYAVRTKACNVAWNELFEWFFGPAAFQVADVG